MSADDFTFLPAAICAFQVSDRSYSYTKFQGIEDITISIDGQKLIDFNSEFVLLANTDNTKFYSYAKSEMK